MASIHHTLITALAVLAAGHATAADKIKVGFLATASNAPTIGFSRELRAGFDLALKQLGGKLGGLPVEVINGDDQGNPDMAKQVFDRMVKRDKVDVVTGTVASGVIYAIAPLAAQSQVFFINPNVGSIDLVGAKCSPWYFNTGWHIGSANEAMGRHLSTAGFKKVYLVGAGVPVGREHLGAFKSTYTGTIAGETYFKPQTLDFSAELAQIRAAQPDAVYAFSFGQLSINFIKQYAQAGLKHIPLFGPAPLADEETIAAAGDAIVGVTSAGHWSLDLPNDANKQFAAAFQKEHNRPAQLASEQGYTTALVLDAAVRAAGGKVEDRQALRKALASVQVDAPRGALRFNTDHSPVQNIYLRNVVKGAGGELVNRTQSTIATAHRVREAGECRM